jgi:hypothetical protein
MSAIDVIAAQTLPIKIWLAWMFAVNFASVFFLRQVAARWVLAAQVASVVSMQVLLKLYGTGHHISLPHVVFWTPLLIYLFTQRKSFSNGSAFGVWCVVLCATDFASLALDYASVIKLLGA